VTKEEMLAFLKGRVAAWWLPDDVIVVPALPHTATGKLLKTALREQFKDHLMTKATPGHRQHHRSPAARL
jgi:fatty-acyl-CoA synthase